ncbi:hypothetical protein BH11MYX4_BH11MYX4_50950 [soil metagenome]
MYQRISLLIALAALAGACAAPTSSEGETGSADDALSASSHSCAIVLNDATLDSLGRSQCSLGATVDVSRSVTSLETVQLLYRVAGQDWARLPAGAEVAGAGDGFRRFSFRLPQLACNPVELIPFYTSADGTVWDHNRTAGNYVLGGGGATRIEPSSVCAAPKDVADRSCQVVLNDAVVNAIGRSQCGLDATVDVARSMTTLEKVQLLYRVAGQGWVTLPASAEVPGAGAAFRRFSFHVAPFGCNPVELIPLATAQGITRWDHNRTDGNYTLGGDSGNRVDPGNACR